jgi:hypothetical protein
VYDKRIKTLSPLLANLARNRTALRTRPVNLCCASAHVYTVHHFKIKAPKLNTTDPQCPQEVKNVRDKNIVLSYFLFLVEIVVNGSLIMVICLKTG